MGEFGSLPCLSWVNSSKRAPAEIPFDMKLTLVNVSLNISKYVDRCMILSSIQGLFDCEGS